jgi:hypothetical protein
MTANKTDSLVCSHFSQLFVESLEFFTSAEEERNAPDTRESHYRIDYAAQNSILTAAYPSDEIKAKKPDATPVERADYRDN